MRTVQDMTPFEQECIAMIEKLETVALARAEQRLRAATAAVARAQAEIAAFRVAIDVQRQLNAEESSDGD